MGGIKRGPSLPAYVLSFAGAALLLVPGVWLWAADTGQSIPAPDFALLYAPIGLTTLAAAFLTALPAALAAAAAGFLLGCLLASRRKAAWVLAPVWLAGLFFLYAQQLLSFLPEEAALFLSPAAALPISPWVPTALGLLPPAAVCAGAFAGSIRPALYRAARDLGASRLRACVTFLLPRALPGLPAAFFAALLPGMGLALVNAQEASIAYAVPASAALLLTALLLLLLCGLTQKNGRTSPC